MSVYLNGTSVLLNGGNVATSDACCCGGTCCPLFFGYTTITFDGEVLGCGTPPTLPEKVWTRSSGFPSCTLSLHEWSVDPACGCQFFAQNCFPFVPDNEIDIDQTGDCSDINYGACLLTAQIDCNTGLASLAGSANPPCCDISGADLSFHVYDISSGFLDVTYASDTNPLVRFHYTITFA